MRFEGFSLVEVLVVTFIVAILATVFARQLSLTFKFWNARADESRVIQNVRDSLMVVTNHVRGIDRLFRVSEPGDKQGYISFVSNSDSQKVPEDAFEVHLGTTLADSETIWNSLVLGNYLDEEGNILNRFRSYSNDFELDIVQTCGEEKDDIVSVITENYQEETVFFYNSPANQARFDTNTFPTDSLVYYKNVSGGGNVFEEILADVESFSITGYEEYRDDRTSSMNPTDNVDIIGSLSISISKHNEDGKLITLEDLLYLRENRFALPGDWKIGDNQPIGFNKNQYGENQEYDYEDFSEPDTVTDNWDTDLYGTVEINVNTIDNILKLTDSSYIDRVDKITYKSELPDEDWWFSVDLKFRSRPPHYPYNSMALRLQDSYDEDNYIDFMLQENKISFWRGNTKVKEKFVPVNNTNDSYHNLLLEYDSENKMVSAYFDHEKTPTMNLYNWIPYDRIKAGIVHWRSPGHMEANIRNFIISKQNNYNVEITSENISLRDIDQDYLVKNSGEYIYGIYTSPVFEISGNLPAHFYKFKLEQDSQLPLETSVYLKIDQRDWYSLPVIDHTINTAGFNITYLAGNEFQYRVEVKSPDKETNRTADLETVRIDWQ